MDERNLYAFLFEELTMSSAVEGAASRKSPVGSVVKERACTGATLGDQLPVEQAGRDEEATIRCQGAVGPAQISRPLADCMSHLQVVTSRACKHAIQ